jgi:hypothetical protein
MANTISLNQLPAESVAPAGGVLHCYDPTQPVGLRDVQLAVTAFQGAISTQTANTVFAGPTSGGSAAPSFRSLVVADLPTVDIAHGGTGATTQAAALAAVLGASAIQVVNGGTGQNSFPAHSVVLGQGGGTAFAAASIGAAGTVLASSGIGADPAFRLLTSADVSGTATNNNAASGIVGEYLTNSTAGTSLTTATPGNATSISLPAGDWDVSAVVTFVPAGSTVPSILSTGVNTTSATLPGSNTGGYVQLASSFPAGAAQVQNSPTVRVSLASTTTVYAVAQSTFITSTMTCNGFIRARRVR